jgi:hypothetical protein
MRWQLTHAPDSVAVAPRRGVVRSLARRQDGRVRIQVGENEYDARKLDDETLKAAVEAIDLDGYVVLGGVIDLAVLDAMKPKLDEDTAELLR